MAGVTEQGFVIKRLPEVLSNLQEEARRLFQDLVPPGEVVDVSPSSSLGRLIGLATPSAVDGWEAAQQVYAAFDPNSATGIPLDNLVAYAGITRFEQTFTTSPVFVIGNTNTLITTDASVQSPTTGNRFTVASPIALQPTSCSSIGVQIGVVADSTLYRITYANTTTTQNISFTSGIGATVQTILDGLKFEVDSNHPSLTATIVGTQLNVTRVDLFQRVGFTFTNNLNLIKVGNVGDVIAEEAGPLEQQPNTITQILTPQLGWDSVTNHIVASPGSNRETDEELRERFRVSKFDRASNTLDSIFSALSIVEGVEQLVIYENDTDVTDSNGVPPHSFLPIVVGGLSTDIANSIWDNKPVGILSFGNTTVSIDDIQGFPHDVSFSRPDPVVIHIEMTLTTDDDFPGNGADLIKSNLIEYFRSSLGIADDVVYSRLYTPINNVPGHQVDSLFIGLASSPTGVVNIPIDFDEVASLSDINIVVNIP